MRNLLKRLVLWALSANPPPPYDPAELDRISAELRKGG